MCGHQVATHSCDGSLIQCPWWWTNHQSMVYRFFFFFLFLDPQECHDQSSSRLPPENEEKHLNLPSTICISFKHISATGAVKLLQLDT